MLPQREQVNRVLSDNGIPTLDEDPSVLMAMIGKQINTHADLASFLFTRVDEQYRSIALETLRPWLAFQPHPLDVYAAQIKLKAEKLQLPTMSEDGLTVIPFQVGEVGDKRLEDIATEALAKKWVVLTCSKCTQMEKFSGETHVDATIKAREAGWVRDLKLGRETCPKCPAIREKPCAADVRGEIAT